MYKSWIQFIYDEGGRIVIEIRSIWEDENKSGWYATRKHWKIIEWEQRDRNQKWDAELVWSYRIVVTNNGPLVIPMVSLQSHAMLDWSNGHLELRLVQNMPTPGWQKLAEIKLNSEGEAILLS